MSILAASRASPPAARRNEVAELRAQIEVLAEMSGISAADVRAEARRRIQGKAGVGRDRARVV